MLEEYCPRCQSELSLKKEPFKVRNTYVGAFEAMSCPICGYYYFTDREYDFALDQARSLGLVGPIEPLPNKDLLPGVRGEFVLSAQVFELEFGSANLTIPSMLRIPEKTKITMQDFSEPEAPNVRTPPNLVPVEVKVTYGPGEP